MSLKLKLKNKECQAKKYIKELIVNNIENDVEEKKKEEYLERLEDPDQVYSLLWELGLVDDLADIFSPLAISTYDIQNARTVQVGEVTLDAEGAIFIGAEEMTPKNQVLSFSILRQVISSQKRGQVANILQQKGYGKYSPDFWIIPEFDNQSTKVSAFSTEKLE